MNFRIQSIEPILYLLFNFIFLLPLSAFLLQILVKLIGTIQVHFIRLLSLCFIQNLIQIVLLFGVTLILTKIYPAGFFWLVAAHYLLHPVSSFVVFYYGIRDAENNKLSIGYSIGIALFHSILINLTCCFCNYGLITVFDFIKNNF